MTMLLTAVLSALIVISAGVAIVGVRLLMAAWADDDLPEADQKKEAFKRLHVP